MRLEGNFFEFILFLSLSKYYIFFPFFVLSEVTAWVLSVHRISKFWTRAAYWHLFLLTFDCKSFLAVFIQTLIMMTAYGYVEAEKALTVVMDNCGGQNKNNNVLRLALYIVECKYFYHAKSAFFVPGHNQEWLPSLFQTTKAEESQAKLIHHVATGWLFKLSW